MTERGSIVLSLYSQRSPISSEALRKIAASFKDRFIARTSPGRWVELGQKEDGTGDAPADVPTPFPPYETNSLSHFTGAVSFRSEPFSKQPATSELRVALADEFTEDGRTTVVAQVVQGLEILTALSSEPRQPASPQVLLKPLKITDVQVVSNAGN